MQFVVVSEHAPNLCPTSNAQTRELMREGAKELPTLAQKLIQRRGGTTPVAEEETAEEVPEKGASLGGQDKHGRAPPRFPVAVSIQRDRLCGYVGRGPQSTNRGLKSENGRIACLAWPSVRITFNADWSPSSRRNTIQRPSGE